METQKHYEICPCKPKLIEENKNYTCVICNFYSNSEFVLKRHSRDNHDISTKSTSPKPKRRRKADIDDKMETSDFKEVTIDGIDLTKDGEVYWSDAREGFNPIDVEKHILLKRSKSQDEKVRKKN